MKNKDMYHGQTEEHETITLIKEVVNELQNSWKLENDQIRPEGQSLLAFAVEGAKMLNEQTDDGRKPIGYV